MLAEPEKSRVGKAEGTTFRDNAWYKVCAIQMTRVILHQGINHHTVFKTPVFDHYACGCTSQHRDPVDCTAQ